MLMQNKLKEIKYKYMNFLEGITPREYQQKIFSTCKDKNCLVILPTGTGKTLIALMLAIERMNLFPREKVVFLAPTRPLAEQHLSYFKKHLPELFGEMILFTGKVSPEKRKKEWETADIIFSTPQCVANDLKNKLYTLEDVSLLIEDEAHRCIKNYDYNYVAQTYKEQASHQRILGLTASPGSEREKIKQICKNLSVEALEIRTRDSPDVKEYLQDLKMNLVKIEFPEKFEEIRQPLKKLFNDYVDELKSRHLLFEMPSKTNLIKLQKKFGMSLSKGSPNFNVLRGMAVCANAIKLQHSLELLETQTLQGFYDYLKELFKQASAKKSKGVQQLVKKPEFNYAYIKTTELIAGKTEHPKISALNQLLKETYSKNPDAKCIVFTQYRATASLLCEKLNENLKINSRVFIGQAKKNGYGMSQKEQQQMIKDFSYGNVNVLCATSILEEGLDIPEVNKVIFYEPVPSEIRKIQRTGRTARLFPGELIILMTKNTRDEAFHWASFSREKKMHKTIDSMREEMLDKPEKQEKLE